MKITQEQLQKIIQEEIQRLVEFNSGQATEKTTAAKFGRELAGSPFRQEFTSARATNPEVASLKELIGLMTNARKLGKKWDSGRVGTLIDQLKGELAKTIPPKPQTSQAKPPKRRLS